MAFFSNTYAHDSQLRRKKSTSSLSRDKSSRPSFDTSRSPIDERKTSSFRYPSPIQANPSSAPLSVPPSVTPPTDRERPRPRYENTSASSTKHAKQIVPPPLLNLVIPVQSNDMSDQSVPASPRKAVKRPITSPSRLPSSPLVDLRCVGQISTPSFNQPPSWSPMQLQGSPSHASSESSSAQPSPHLPIESTPVTRSSSESPLINDIVNPILSPIPHPISAASSPTARSFTSTPGSIRSSTRRVPVPPYDRSEFTLASGSGSGSTSNLSHDASKQPKKPRNILRKPSVTRRQQQQDSISAPVSDNEYKAKIGKEKSKGKEHRPRSKSVILSRSKGSSGAPVFDIVAPMPSPAVVDLTPAREVVVAYQEAQRLANATEPIRGSGTVVAVGGPESSKTSLSGRSNWIPPWAGDGQHHGHARVSSDKQRPGAESRDGKPTTLRTLSRKLSARLQPHPERRMHSQSANRRSLSGALDFFGAGSSSSGGEAAIGERSVTSPTTMTRPTDWFVARGPQSAKSRKGSDWPSADRNAGEGRVWDDTVGDCVTKQEKPSKEEQEVSNPGRLWRIVKRFSSGNLKEKRGMMVETAPPVPPLPKEILRTQPIPVQDDPDEIPLSPSSPPEIQGGIMRYITNVPTLNIARPKSLKALRQEEAGSPPRSSSGTAPRRWRSATTRSSSPSSSATTGIFPRSRCSSDSSYGESIPPIPGIPLAHVNKSHIASTVETRPKKSEDDARLPLRRHKPQDGSPSPTGSATMPTFESNNPVNHFPVKKSKRVPPPPLPIVSCPATGSTSKAVNVQSPPIPARSPYRAMVGHAFRKQSMPDVNPAIVESQTQTQRRPSDQSPKLRPRSVSDSDITAEMERQLQVQVRRKGAASPSMFMFREMSTTPRHLTEQEKNAKWEDLLRRSAKAGGTLHVRSPAGGNSGLGLWSDRSSLAISVSDSLDQAGSVRGK